MAEFAEESVNEIAARVRMVGKLRRLRILGSVGLAGEEFFEVEEGGKVAEDRGVVFVKFSEDMIQ